MPNVNYSYYILDTNGQSQGGPYNVQQLQTLADQGTIVPDTPLGRSDGVRGYARQIRGLVFPETLDTSPDPPDDPRAMYDLACNYLRNRNNSFYKFFYYLKNIKPIEEAIRLLTQAAVQGLADAQYAIGLRYANGDGVEKNEAVAFHWFERAASQGHADAQAKLRVEEDRRRVQEADERYKQDILSGRISYDSELRQLAARFDEYAAVNRDEVVQLMEQHQRVFRDFLRGGDDNGADILRKIEERLRTTSIDDVLAKARRLNGIRRDARVSQLIEYCEIAQSARHVTESYVRENRGYRY